MALESTLLVDGGQTVVFQGFRVAPDMRGCGIAGALKRHVTAYIRRHYPEVRVVRLSRGDQPSPQVLAKYRLIAKEVCHNVETDIFSHHTLWGLKSNFGTEIWSPQGKLVRYGIRCCLFLIRV